MNTTSKLVLLVVGVVVWDWFQSPTGFEALATRIASAAGASAGTTGGKSAVSQAGDSLAKIAAAAAAAYASVSADTQPGAGG